MKFRAEKFPFWVCKFEYIYSQEVLIYKVSVTGKELSLSAIAYRYSSSLLKILVFAFPDGGLEFFPLELEVPFPLEEDLGRCNEDELGRDALKGKFFIG